MIQRFWSSHFKTVYSVTFICFMQEKKFAWAPVTIFSGMCLLAGFVIQFLPETRGHELPQTMEEIKEWYRANIPSSKQKAKQLQNQKKSKL